MWNFITKLTAATLSLLLVTSDIGAANQKAKSAKHVTIQANNTSVRTLLMQLARTANVSISLSPEITGYVTVSLRDVPLTAALAAILSPLGDSYHEKGGVYFIDSAPSGSIQAPQTSESVLPVSAITARQAGAQLRAIFPDASIRVSANSNSLLVVAPQGTLQEIKSVLQGIDVRDPTEKLPTPVTLKTLNAPRLKLALNSAFPDCNFRVVSQTQLLSACRPQDATLVASTIATLDAPISTPAPQQSASETVRIIERDPREVARAAQSQIPGVRAAVSGSLVILTGSPDAVARAKTLVASLDVPLASSTYLQVYKIRSIDAASVSDLLQHNIPDIEITIEKDLNALAIRATTSEHQRIQAAITQLDDPATSAGQSSGSIAPSGLTKQLVTLKSTVPLSSGSGDIAATVTQGLQALTPDVHVFPLPVTGQLMLVGPPMSVRAARDFIDAIDVVPRQVVLDTEVLEVDETVAKNLGVQLGTAVLSTTYTEATPAPNALGVTPSFDRLQGLGRTPLSFTAELNLLIQNGKGRVLADPRITTLSGRTASIKAGDNISILTTTAGNVGTIATTQVQSFQTGVTLDITPLVDDNDGITVTLHPVVNSLIGLNNGIPEISTRDTQTTVRLKNNETLVIGGLIQENDTRNNDETTGTW